MLCLFFLLLGALRRKCFQIYNICGGLARRKGEDGTIALESMWIIGGLKALMRIGHELLPTNAKISSVK
ncbi:hypothetical protein V6Z11_D07G217700 [Gossypium hirsutum]